eukprot:Rhum_TRINITY_DN13305_c0_g1::Rhum_TRINITY_DN13305_c0_g1_i1::g.58934::m.58934
MQPATSLRPRAFWLWQLVAVPAALLLTLGTAATTVAGANTATATASDSVSLTETQSLRMGRVSVAHPAHLYLNPSQSPEVAIQATVTVEAFPEYYTATSDTTYQVLVVAESAIKVSVSPAAGVLVTCCDTSQTYTFTLFGRDVGPESVHWAVAPLVDPNATAPAAAAAATPAPSDAAPALAALWERVPNTPIFVRDRIAVDASGYDYFKGEYPGLASPPLAVSLSAAPDAGVRVTFYVDAVDVQVSAPSEAAGSYTVYEALANATEAALNGSVVAFDPPFLEFAGGGGVPGAAEVRVTCLLPGTYEVRIRLGGADSPLLYTGSTGWTHTCLAPVPLVLDTLGAPQPFAASRSAYLEVRPAAAHRDHASFELLVTCEAVHPPVAATAPAGAATVSVTTTAGAASGNATEEPPVAAAATPPAPPPPTVVFYPEVLRLTSQAGARVQLEASAPGTFAVACRATGGADVRDFVDPEALAAYEVLPRHVVAQPAVPTIRVLDGERGVSGLVTLDLGAAPRVAATVAVAGVSYDEGAREVSVEPPLLHYDASTAALSFRVFTAWNATEVVLSFALSGPSADNYEGAPDPVRVNVTGPNPACDAASAASQAACAALWEETCWWDAGSSACRGDLMAFETPTLTPQYEGEGIPHQVVMRGQVRDGVSVTLSGGHLAVSPGATLEWAAGAEDGAAKSFVLTASLPPHVGEVADLELAYRVTGPDYHRFEPPPPSPVRALGLLSVLNPVGNHNSYPLVPLEATTPTQFMLLSQPPTATLTATPSSAPGSGLSFSPQQLVFAPGVDVRPYTVTGVAAGLYNVTWTLSGADAAHYVPPSWKALRVVDKVRVVPAALPTVNQGEWSRPQVVRTLRSPAGDVSVVVAASVDPRPQAPHGPVVQLRACDARGVPLVAGSGGNGGGTVGVGTVVPAAPAPSNEVVLVFEKEQQRPLYYQVLGTLPGSYEVTYAVEGVAKGDFAAIAPATLVVHAPAVWASPMKQMGVDPSCRINVGVKLFTKLGVADSPQETCSINDPFDASLLCGATSQTECEADLREKGIPCVWRAATAACEYGLPHGNVTHYAVGGRHSVFRLLDGSVWTAGNNDFGQLGHSCLGAAGCSASESFQEVLFENRDLFGTCVET